MCNIIGRRECNNYDVAKHTQSHTDADVYTHLEQ